KPESERLAHRGRVGVFHDDHPADGSRLPLRQEGRILHRLRAGRLRKEVVAGREREPPESREAALFVRKRLVIAPVVRKDHVDDRAGDEDDDRGKKDREPQRKDRNHRDLLFFLRPQFQLRPRSWSRLTLPPERTTATFAPAGRLTRPWSSAATGAAAAPSTTSLQRSITQLIASKISRSGSAHRAHTNRCTTGKLFSRTRRTRRPSMIVRQSIVWRLPASTLSFIAGPSEDSPPMTRIFGLCALTAIATPEINPPPPIGTMTASTSGQSCAISSPSVPWPAISSSSSKGWT